MANPSGVQNFLHWFILVLPTPTCLGIKDLVVGCCVVYIGVGFCVIIGHIFMNALRFVHCFLMSYLLLMVYQ
jgi:hypothetical protein